VIVGIGVDLVEIERIDDLLAKFGDAAGARVFTERERRDSGTGPAAAASLAARFAAKEAAMKALGTGWSEGVGFTDVEIERDERRAPRLLLHRAAAVRARALGVTRMHLTMTHTRTTACAVVVLES
jgi:holo-[acyl-carrier protein] synthase